MEETLTAHQEALIEADMIVQASLSVSIADAGEVLAHIMEAVLFHLSLNDKEKAEAYEHVRSICLTAYEYAVDREAKSIGLRK